MPSQTAPVSLWIKEAAHQQAKGNTKSALAAAKRARTQAKRDGDKAMVTELNLLVESFEMVLKT